MRWIWGCDVAEISELVAELEERAASARNARQIDHLRSRMESITKEFRGLAESIEPISAFIHECMDAQILTDYPTDGSLCSQELSRMIENQLDDAEALLDSSEFSSLLFRLTAIVASWRSQVEGAWKEYCDKHIPKRQDAVIHAFESSGESVELLSRLKSIDEQLTLLSRQAPIDRSGGPALLSQLIKNRAEIWSQLSVGDVPVEVTLFLDNASGSGASLTMLTPNVRDWLTAKNLEEGFVITSRVDNV